MQVVQLHQHKCADRRSTRLAYLTQSNEATGRNPAWWQHSGHLMNEISWESVQGLAHHPLAGTDVFRVSGTAEQLVLSLANGATNITLAHNLKKVVVLRIVLPKNQKRKERLASNTIYGTRSREGIHRGM